MSSVYMFMWVCTVVHEHVCLEWVPEVDMKCLPQSPFTLFIETKSLPRLETHWFG